MFRLPLLKLALLLSLLIPSCSRNDVVIDDAPGFEVKLEVFPSPAQTGPSELKITIYDEQSNPVEDLVLKVRGDMSHAGMTPITVDGIQAELGTFTVPFEWTMAGDWMITITTTLPDGRTLYRVQPVQVNP